MAMHLTENICQTCGDKGFSRALIYCTECWSTVEHIYCLGLSCNDISEDFSWVCDSCKSADEKLAKMIIYGDKPNEIPKVGGCDPSTIPDHALPSTSTIPVVGPIWRGAFNTIGSFNGSIRGVEAFMPKTSYSKVVKIVQSMQPSLCFHMKNRCDVWPKNFDDIGAADSRICLYIFPESSSSCDRSEVDYNNLVEYMIANDLAMTTNLASIELIVFTSLEIAALEKHKIRGKYYLWGRLKESKSRENPSKYYRISAAKKRIGKSARTVELPNKPFTESNQYTACKKNTGLAYLLMRFDCIPSIRPECKRARSKRGKSSPGETKISCLQRQVKQGITGQVMVSQAKLKPAEFKKPLIQRMSTSTCSRDKDTLNCD